MFFYAYLSFIIGFVFFVLHESNLFRCSFCKLGKWFQPNNPTEMKKKFPLFAPFWNFYHFCGWITLWMFFNSIFFAAYDQLNGSHYVSYLTIGGSLAFITYIIDVLLYGIGGNKK